MYCDMYIVLVNGKLADNTTNLFLPFWCYNQKNIVSIAVIASACD